MKQFVFILIAIAIIVIVDSCESKKSTNTSGNNNSVATSESATCPMCGGTGIFEWIKGDVFAPKERCSGCNGTGSTTVQKAREIIEAQGQAERFFGGDSNGGNSNNQCTRCLGSGKCTFCAGRGEKRIKYSGGQKLIDCDMCHGTGRCQVCYESGNRR